MQPSSANKQVLLIEDTPSLLLVYRSILQSAGYSVLSAQTATAGLQLFIDHQPPIMLLDLMLPDRDGFALMRDILSRSPHTRVVVITANATINRAVEAMRAGAHDFLVKPFDETRFLNAVENALASNVPPKEPAGPVTLPTVEQNLPSEAGRLVWSSPAMRSVNKVIQSVAPSMATAFITGECGTGKEVCAQAIHDASPRSNGPFVVLNCGAIPPDLLESEVFGHVKGSFPGAISDKPGAAADADGGTLFLDEICEMALPLQIKLLRFLQTSTVQPVGSLRSRRVNTRIICSTNRDPLAAVANGEFREDLFYRLYVVPIHIPPLKQRGEDVIEIAHDALARFSKEEGKRFDGFSDEAKDQLRAFDWPGNVRQLLNVVRNIVVMNPGGTVSAAMLPEMMQSIRFATEAADMSKPKGTGGPQTLNEIIGMRLADIERIVIVETIARNGGSVTRAALMLDVAPSTLYRKLEQWKDSIPSDSYS